MVDYMLLPDGMGLIFYFFQRMNEQTQVGSMATGSFTLLQNRSQWPFSRTHLPTG